MTRSEELRDVVKSRKFTVLCKAWEVRTTNVDLEAVYIAINQDAKQSKTRQSKAKQSKASQLFMEYSNVTQLGKDSDASEEAPTPVPAWSPEPSYQPRSRRRSMMNAQH